MFTNAIKNLCLNRLLLQIFHALAAKTGLPVYFIILRQIATSLKLSLHH